MNDLELLVRRSLVRYVDQEATDLAEFAEARPRARRTRPFVAALVAAAVVLIGGTSTSRASRPAIKGRLASADRWSDAQFGGHHAPERRIRLVEDPRFRSTT